MTQKYRKGDVVTITAIVETQYADTEDLTSIRNRVSIRVQGQSSILVEPDQLTLVTPFFAPGERVQKKQRDGRNYIRGTVIAMSETDVWVKFDNGKHGTVPAVALEPSTEAGPHVVAA